MDESVRDPGEEIEDGMFVGGQDVAQVGAVQDVLEGGQDAYPDGGAIIRGNISMDPGLAKCAQGFKDGGSTYFALENKSSHVSVGSNGRRNWRVIGRHRPVMSSVATNVFANGPGDSLTEREKMATMARNRYCAS